MDKQQALSCIAKTRQLLEQCKKSGNLTRAYYALLAASKTAFPSDDSYSQTIAWTGSESWSFDFFEEKIQEMQDALELLPDPAGEPPAFEAKYDVFISQTTQDQVLVDAFFSLLLAIGVKPERIFCSSKNGNGLKGNQRLPIDIGDAITHSKVVVYLISNDFLRSPYCIQELAFAWLFPSRDYHLLKCDSVNRNEIEGFIGKDHLISDITTKTMLSAVSQIEESLGLGASLEKDNESISTFLSAAASNIHRIEEKNDEPKSPLKEAYNLLTDAEKRLYVQMLNSDDHGLENVISDYSLEDMRKRGFVTLEIINRMYHYQLTDEAIILGKENPIVKDDLRHFAYRAVSPI